MIIVHVFIHVKQEFIEEFKMATIENAQNSVLEPGIARFDVIQQADDPARFVLVEVYRTSDAPLAHKQTAHYEKWRINVKEMMADMRTSTKFRNIFPEDSSW